MQIISTYVNLQFRAFLQLGAQSPISRITTFPTLTGNTARRAAKPSPTCQAHDIPTLQAWGHLNYQAWGIPNYQAWDRSACWRIHACIAIPAATPALMDRVEPN